MAKFLLRKFPRLWFYLLQLLIETSTKAWQTRKIIFKVSFFPLYKKNIYFMMIIRCVIWVDWVVFLHFIFVMNIFTYNFDIWDWSIMDRGTIVKLAWNSSCLTATVMLRFCAFFLFILSLFWKKAASVRSVWYGKIASPSMHSSRKQSL